MPIPFIYKIPEDKSLKGRKIVVIDGQPFYESTGRNSGKPDIWFPFIMIRGSKSVGNIQSSLFYSKLSKKINEKTNKHYLVKVLRNYVKETVITIPKDKDDKITLRRNSLKTHLIIAARLSGPKFPEKTLLNAGLTPDELKLAREPLILEDKPLFSTRDAHLVNKWLIENGAETVTQLLDKKNEPSSIEEKDSKALPQTAFESSSHSKIQKHRFKPY